MDLSENCKSSSGTILFLIENMFNDKSNMLRVQLNNSVIFFSKNDQSIHLEGIKCISPSTLKHFSEIEKLEFDNVYQYEQSTMWKFLYKCQELKSLVLSGNCICYLKT